jgi:hypothetical protein
MTSNTASAQAMPMKLPVSNREARGIPTKGIFVTSCYALKAEG